MSTQQSKFTNDRRPYYAYNTISALANLYQVSVPTFYKMLKAYDLWHIIERKREKGVKTLTPAEVKIIIDTLGDPRLRV